jgi:DNA-binding NtrC family response regulator
LELLCHYDWPGNVRELLSMVERLAAKARGRIITIDQVRREIDVEQKPLLVSSNADCFPRLREDETITDYLCRGLLTVYEQERAHLGSHSAAAHRLGLHRNTLYDWLERARRHGAKSTTAPNR